MPVVSPCIQVLQGALYGVGSPVSLAMAQLSEGKLDPKVRMPFGVSIPLTQSSVSSATSIAGSLIGDSIEAFAAKKMCGTSTTLGGEFRSNCTGSVLEKVGLSTGSKVADQITTAALTDFSTNAMESGANMLQGKSPTSVAQVMKGATRSVIGGLPINVGLAVASHVSDSPITRTLAAGITAGLTSIVTSVNMSSVVSCITANSGKALRQAGLQALKSAARGNPLAAVGIAATMQGFKEMKAKMDSIKSAAIKEPEIEHPQEHRTTFGRR